MAISRLVQFESWSDNIETTFSVVCCAKLKSPGAKFLIKNPRSHDFHFCCGACYWVQKMYHRRSVHDQLYTSAWRRTASPTTGADDDCPLVLKVAATIQRLDRRLRARVGARCRPSIPTWCLNREHAKARHFSAFQTIRSSGISRKCGTSTFPVPAPRARHAHVMRPNADRRWYGARHLRTSASKIYSYVTENFGGQRGHETRQNRSNNGSRYFSISNVNR